MLEFARRAQRAHADARLPVLERERQFRRVQAFDLNGNVSVLVCGGLCSFFWRLGHQRPWGIVPRLAGVLLCKKAALVYVSRDGRRTACFVAALDLVSSHRHTPCDLDAPGRSRDAPAGRASTARGAWVAGAADVTGAVRSRGLITLDSLKRDCRQPILIWNVYAVRPTSFRARHRAAIVAHGRENP